MNLKKKASPPPPTHLRDQADVHHARRHGRLHRDEARLATHQLDQAQAVAGRGGLNLGGQQGSLGL